MTSWTAAHRPALSSSRRSRPSFLMLMLMLPFCSVLLLLLPSSATAWQPPPRVAAPMGMGAESQHWDPRYLAPPMASYGREQAQAQAPPPQQGATEGYYYYYPPTQPLPGQQAPLVAGRGPQAAFQQEAPWPIPYRGYGPYGYEYRGFPPGSDGGREPSIDPAADIRAPLVRREAGPPVAYEEYAAPVYAQSSAEYPVEQGGSQLRMQQPLQPQQQGELQYKQQRLQYDAYAARPERPRRPAQEYYPERAPTDPARHHYFGGGQSHSFSQEPKVVSQRVRNHNVPSSQDGGPTESNLKAPETDPNADWPGHEKTEPLELPQPVPVPTPAPIPVAAAATKHAEVEATTTIAPNTTNETSTGESMGHLQKATGLPEWLLIIIAVVGASVSVLATGAVAAALLGGQRAVPTEAEKIEKELEDIRAHAEALNQALVERRLEEQRERLERERLEREANDPAGTAAAAAEAEAAGVTGEVEHDALIGEMHARTAGLDREINRNIQETIGQSAQIIAKADAVKNILQSGVKDIRGQAEQLAKDGAMQLVGRVQEAVGSEVEVPPWLLQLQNGEGAQLRIVPPFGLLIAGSFAPQQTASVRGSAGLSMTAHAILVAICAAVACIDYGKPCSDDRIWFWVLGSAISSGVAVLSNSIIKQRCDIAMEEMKREASNSDGTLKTGIPLWDMFNGIQQGTGRLFRNLLRYDHIVKSPYYHISKLGNVFFVFWGGYGFWITVHDIVEDEEHCDLNMLVTFLHIYTFFYVLLLLFIIIGVVLWIISAVSKMSFVQRPIIKICRDMDDMNPMRLPIFLSLARVFILGGASDMLSMQEDEIANDIKDLEKVYEETAREIEAKKRQAEEVKAQRAEAEESEGRLIEVYQKQVDEGLAQAAPFVAMLAAGQQGHGPMAEAAARLQDSAANMAQSAQVAQAQADAFAAGSAALGQLQAGLEESAASAGSSSDYLGSFQQGWQAATMNSGPAFEFARQQAEAARQQAEGAMQSGSASGALLAAMGGSSAPASSSSIVGPTGPTAGPMSALPRTSTGSASASASAAAAAATATAAPAPAPKPAPKPAAQQAPGPAAPRISLTTTPPLSAGAPVEAAAPTAATPRAMTETTSRASAYSVIEEVQPETEAATTTVTPAQAQGGAAPSRASVAGASTSPQVQATSEEAVLEGGASGSASASSAASPTAAAAEQQTTTQPQQPPNLNGDPAAPRQQPQDDEQQR